MSDNKPTIKYGPAVLDNIQRELSEQARSELAAATGSVPVSELVDLAATWRRQAAVLCPGFSQLALESCAMDLSRLADSFSRSPNTDYPKPKA